jgi:hypothetical protein
MIVGNPSTFAIESDISQAYERLSFRGLGCFLIHIGSLSYGVRAPDATMLACSFNEVVARLKSRGRHTAFFSREVDGGAVADAVSNAIYVDDREHAGYFGVSGDAFREVLWSNQLVWAPDGDEAFDDGSCVLQFDVEKRVRLIGFRRREGQVHDPSTLRDVWLEADDFYDVLDHWRIAFEAEWSALPKVPEGDVK